MRIPRLHVDVPLAVGARITLPESAGRHATRVLRLGAGDAVTVFDGRGGEFRATLARIARGVVEVEVGAHDAVDRESTLAIELGQGICKGDRMDLVVQKATELGVCAIRPLVCERTVVRLDPARAQRRIEHWRAIAVHAAQQCGRTRVPRIAGVEDLAAWLARPRAAPGLVLSPFADASLSDLAPPAPGATERCGGLRASQARDPGPAPPAPGTALCLLVGPEGGLSPAEVERVCAAGFTALRLGPRVLRTETAALVALAALQARWGDLR